jgi:hypothetical protein
MEAKCAYCKSVFEIATGAYNRAIGKGLNVYCNKTCAGFGRRKTVEEKKARVAEYDKERRRLLADRIKREKAEYHKRTYDPVQAAIKRKERMHLHIERMRQPKWVAYKREYDKKRRAKMDYGEFGEAAILLRSLESELERKSPELLVIKFQNKTVNKSQFRKNNGKTHSKQPEKHTLGNTEQSERRLYGLRSSRCHRVASQRNPAHYKSAIAD